MKHRKLPSAADTARTLLLCVAVPLLVVALLVSTLIRLDDEEPTATTTARDTAMTVDSDSTGTSPAGMPDDYPAEPTDPVPEAEQEPKSDIKRAFRRHRASQRRLAETVANELAEQSESERAEPRFSFRVATYNILGDSHTGPGGNKVGFPDAGPRMDMSIAALRNNGIDVVGFQEFESTQHAMFTARAGEYSLYPGLSLGTKSVRFNIAWRESMWTMVDAHTLSIPYAGGSRIAMPVVLLESIATKRRVWFANFHNPADTPRLGNNARWRAEAAAIEVSHLTALHAEDGVPVIATGDFNERAEIFCRFTGTGVFQAAAGGSASGGCLPPARMEVDWIFGSNDVTFDGYAVTDTGNASDHRLVHSGVTVLPESDASE